MSTYDIHRASAQAASELHKIATETYLLQIKDLTDKLERQKKDNETLLHQSNETKKAMQAERENDKDIMEFLKIQLAAKQKELADYEARLRATSHESDVAVADLQKDISQQTIMSLQDELKKVREELDELNEFKAQKVEMENELEDLKLARENDKCAHKEKLHEVEREVLKEKDKLLKEKEQQVKDIRESLLNMSKAHLDKTTKLTIIENDQITNELAYQAKQTMEMVEQNKKLAAEKVEMKRKMDLMAQIEKDLSKKNTAHLKTIKTLQAKIQSLETDTSEEASRNGRESAFMKEEMAQRDGKIRDLEHNVEELNELRDEKERAQASLASTQKELDDLKRDISVIISTISASNENLRSATIEIFMQAEADHRLHNTVNLYELAENLEIATTAEKEKLLKFVQERLDPPKDEGSPPISKRGSFPRAVTSKTEAPKSPTTNWDATGKIFMGFAAPLPSRTKRTPKAVEQNTTSTSLKETVSVGVQTDSLEKSIFFQDKWSGRSETPGGGNKANKLPPPRIPIKPPSK